LCSNDDGSAVLVRSQVATIVTVHLRLTEVVGGHMLDSEIRSPDGFFNGHSRVDKAEDMLLKGAEIK